VETKQDRYKRTEKGKQAQQTAIVAYRCRRVKWEVWLDMEMSNALEASIPDGVSKADYLRKIFQNHLDNVSCMVDTKDRITQSKKQIL
jgi:hypothetical protein